MRQWWVAVCLGMSLWFWGLAASAQPTLSGRADGAVQLVQEMQEVTSLRLQGQRLAKLYRQLGLNVQVKQAVLALEQGRAQGDSSVRRLARHAQLAGSARVYGRCVAVWQEFRDLVAQPYTPAAAERTAQLAEELSIQAGKLALQIEAGIDSPAGRALDGAARLNMLAQRLARLYFQSLTSDRSQGLLTDMAQTRSEFATGLQELERLPMNGTVAREALGLVRNQWVFLDEATRLAQLGLGGGRDPQYVASSTERIQETLGSLGEHYRAILNPAGRT